MKNAAPSGRTQPLWFIDNLVHVHVDGDTSGGALALLDERGRRGNMPPLHVHRHDDETFYVLEGELTLFVGGEQIVLGPGQAALAPRDVPHAYRVESEEARWLVITTPAGFDAFVPLIDSGISGYFWSARKFLSILIYTCKGFDQEAALATLARLVRERSSAQVVAVVGSTGKTTTKDALAAFCGAVTGVALVALSVTGPGWSGRSVVVSSVFRTSGS